MACANAEIILLSPSYVEEAFEELGSSDTVEKRGDTVRTGDVG